MEMMMMVRNQSMVPQRAPLLDVNGVISALESCLIPLRHHHPRRPHTLSQ